MPNKKLNMKIVCPSCNHYEYADIKKSYLTEIELKEKEMQLYNPCNLCEKGVLPSA